MKIMIKIAQRLRQLATAFHITSFDRNWPIAPAKRGSEVGNHKTLKNAATYNRVVRIRQLFLQRGCHIKRRHLWRTGILSKVRTEKQFVGHQDSAKTVSDFVESCFIQLKLAEIIWNQLKAVITCWIQLKPVKTSWNLLQLIPAEASTSQLNPVDTSWILLTEPWTDCRCWFLWSYSRQRTRLRSRQVKVSSIARTVHFSL